jgi:hypothetical protein
MKEESIESKGYVNISIITIFGIKFGVMWGFYHVRLFPWKMMVWKVWAPKIGLGMCGKDLVLGCYHLEL